MPRLNVGVLGLSHDHVWGNLAALAAGHHGRLVAAADPDAGLRDRLRALHGAVATHDTFDAVLERRDLDAVLVFSDNRTSAELGVRALGRRLPVMLEKPMAADLAGARALLAAARTQTGGEPAFAMIVYGERGTLLVHQPRPTREGERAGAGRVQVVSPEGSRFLDPPPLGPDECDGPTHFLACVSAGRDVTGFCAADVGCDVQEVIAAGQRSSATGRRVELPLQQP